MRSTIYFNGKSSVDFGLIVEYYPESVHAARRGELITIPGRNGVIIREDGAYDTYSQTFQIWFRNTLNRDTFQTARDVAEWLLGASGFCRLEDTYEPEHFRLARFVGPLNVETVLKNHGRATLEFDVQPQRYLKSGETPISYAGDSTTTFSITNPTQFEARPLLKFRDISEKFVPVSQTLETQPHTTISPYTGVITSVQTPLFFTSVPVALDGYDYAIVSGYGYTFLDSNGSSIAYRLRLHQSFRDERLIIPQGASAISVLGIGENSPFSLSLERASQTPGDAAVSINGTTINLDFSVHDAIILDCDLHDAYYIDGSNANSAVSFENRFDDYPTFPGLFPGENTVVVRDGANLDFKLVPRWWTL